MPEITVIHIAIVAGALIVGVILGWAARSSRSGSEKAAINESWQEQLEAQRGEHQRLLEQNKSLMDQNSQYQASNNDAKMRASELSDALKETFERRDELQRQLKEIRSNLEAAVTERDTLRDSASANNFAEQLEQKNARIEKLDAELKNWQDRLPPLIERYQQRNAEAEELESRLAEAQERITALEDMLGSEETRVEPVDQEALTDGMDASNDPIDGNDQSIIEEVEAVDDDSDEELLEAAVIVDDQDVVLDSSPRDDLKLIKGVGPAIEKTLNELGISRFDQIAQMSEYDIDRVANRLKGFRSRIYREDWIGQARNLHDQKVSNQ
jgi:predicted flap endonuclease-1-like 5' DNA nuclease/uncharacterized protein YoxC